MRIYRTAAVLFLLACCFLTGSARGQVGLTRGQSAVEEKLTVYGEFLRTLEEGARMDTLKGSFYYLGPGWIHFEITYPLHQIMVVHNSVITIYYPERHRGFILEGKGPVMLPMIPAITAAVRPDYGLTDLGFQIYGQDVRGDTLFTFWNHSAGDEVLGRFRLAKVGEQLSYAVFEPPDADGEIRTTFEDFKSVNGFTFPSKIRTKNVNLAVEAQELLWLKNLKVNPDIPTHVLEFKIPDDVVIERRKL